MRGGRLFHSCCVTAILLLSHFGCAEKQEKSFTLATTTSVDNSGLLQHLSAIFTARTGIQLHVHVVGSGRALRMADQGRVQATLTHDPDRERAFVASGKAELSRPFARNDFIIVGPPTNPARLERGDGAVGAFKKIHDGSAPFASRGDESGTHARELHLWRKCGVDPRTNPKYVSLGQSMSTLLRSADQLEAYVLSDRATFLQVGRQTRLRLFVDGGDDLTNVYTVMLVRSSEPETKHAAKFVSWLVSDDGRRAISSYRIRGETAFTPVP